jgi:hypothetical protein
MRADYTVHHMRSDSVKECVMRHVVRKHALSRLQIGRDDTAVKRQRCREVIQLAEEYSLSSGNEAMLLHTGPAALSRCSTDAPTRRARAMLARTRTGLCKAERSISPTRRGSPQVKLGTEHSGVR